MKRSCLFLLLTIALVCGCKIKTEQDDPNSKQTIGLAEGVDTVQDSNAQESNAMVIPKSRVHTIGDSIRFRGVMYQVTNFQTLSDTSRLIARLPKSDSTKWIALNVHCRNEGNLQTQPDWGRLEIALDGDTSSYAAIIFRTDWRQVFLQQAESGNFTSVYKIPKQADGTWFWHPGSKNASDSTRFVLK